jgi:hypothetical protein
MAGLFTSTLSVGTHTIGVNYSGDANDVPSSATPISYTVNPNNPANHLAASVSSSPVIINTAFSITVLALNAQGNQDPTFNQPATLSVFSAPAGGALSGPATATFSDGSVTFSGLTVNVPGSYTVVITAGGLQTSLTFSTTGRQS